MGFNNLLHYYLNGPHDLTINVVLVDATLLVAHILSAYCANIFDVNDTVEVPLDINYCWLHFEREKSQYHSLDRIAIAFNSYRIKINRINELIDAFCILVFLFFWLSQCLCEWISGRMPMPHTICCA